MKTLSIQDFWKSPFPSAYLQGRVIALSPRVPGYPFLLRDATGIVEVFSPSPLSLHLGDRIRVLVYRKKRAGKMRNHTRLSLTGKGVEHPRIFARNLQIIHRYRGVPSTGSSWEEFFWGVKSPQILHQRASLYQAIRTFFRRRKYLEVQTPILHPYPTLDPGIVSIPVFLTSGGRKRRFYLQSSPEYWMKMLLVAECQKIFQIATVFRQGEFSPLHHPEFTLLEWYHSGADYFSLMNEVENLLIFLVRKLCGKSSITRGPYSVDVTPPWERMTLVEAFHRFTGLPIYQTTDFYRLGELATGEMKAAAPGPAWKDLYFFLLTRYVEPNLGIHHPTFLYDFPAQLGTMAKGREDDPSTLQRFELYVAGVELANGYTELTNPQEQAKRFRQELKERRIHGLPVEFLKALSCGLPPCAGVALGVDRLLLILFQHTSVASTLPFSLFRE